jgi:TIR domain-containing protein
MAHDVFISHSVKDKAVADAMVARLEAESVTCWVAPRDVVAGADWGESIIDAIESSRIMILIFSQSANTSTQIKREVERAVNKGVYIIPFRVDDIAPARSLEYFISTSQWMDAFSPPLEPHLDNLAKTAKSVLQSPPLPGASVPVQSERKSPMATAQIPRPFSRKAIPIAVAIVALMIVGGVGWYLGHRREALYVTPAGRSTTETAPPKSPSKQTMKHPRKADRNTAAANRATPQTPPPLSPALVDQSAEPTVTGEENTYSGQVGSSEATFRLRFGPMGRVSGTYTQNGRTFRLEGQHPTGKLLLEEYTDAHLTARIELTRKKSAGDIRWEGTMHNTPPDNRSFPVWFSRQRK